MFHLAFLNSRFCAAALVVNLIAIAPIWSDTDVGASQTDSFPDPNADGKAAIGEQIDYETVITNAGDMSAEDVEFLNNIPGNTTFVPGSLKSTPLARDDAYVAVGNVGITIGAGAGLLSNDFDLGPTVPTVVSGSGATTMAGTVTIAADGAFEYLPPAGFNGIDTFTYTIADENGTPLPAPATGSNAAIVSITVSNMIWFIDSSAGGGGDGSLSSPFDSLADHNVNLLDANGDGIFLYEGNHTGGINLQDSQTLVGEGATDSLGVALGLSLPAGSNPLPLTGGTNPTITNAAGNGINLASGNTIRGLDVGDTLSTGISGTGVGSLTISETGISGNGRAINIDGPATLSVTFDSISSVSGGDEGIRLNNVGGTFAVTGDTSIDATTATGIEITNSPSGTFTFADVDVTTTSARGFFVDGGILSSASGTIATTTGIGVDVSNTDLGITFDSVSVNGAPHGINLSDTTGSFTIVGDGGTAQNDSGGQILNTTSDGISLTNATNITFNQIGVANTGRHGVFGTGVENLTVNNSIFWANGNAPNESAFSFHTETLGPDNNISGQFTLNNVDVTHFFDNGINIYADTGNVNIDIIGGSDFIDGADTASKGQAIIVETEGTAGADLTVDGSLFDNIESDAVRFEAGGSGANNVDITNNTVNNPGGPDNFPNGGSFHMIVTDARTLSFDIQGNTMNDLPGDGIIVAATSGGGNISGRIGGPNLADGNIINGGVDAGGFPVSDGIFVTDIGVDALIAETMTLLIQNNTIDVNGGDDGIQFSVGDSDGTYNITIEDNSISNTGSEGIRFFFDDDNNQSPNLALRVVDNSFSNIGDGSIELATRDSAIACTHIAGNDDGSGGSPGTILLDENNLSSIQITQAFLVALSTDNNGALVVEGTAGSVTFSGACTNPALPVLP